MSVASNYIGVTTRRWYKFGDTPAALLSGSTPVQSGSYAGETVVIANADGSVARGMHTGTAETYRPAVTHSPFEGAS